MLEPQHNKNTKHFSLSKVKKYFNLMCVIRLYKPCKNNNNKLITIKKHIRLSISKNVKHNKSKKKKK